MGSLGPKANYNSHGYGGLVLSFLRSTAARVDITWRSKRDGGAPNSLDKFCQTVDARRRAGNSWFGPAQVAGLRHTTLSGKAEDPRNRVVQPKAVHPTRGTAAPNDAVWIR